MMTQRQIAKSLGVSCATVANILSGKPGLRYSQETRDRVIGAAAAMGYQRNRASRAIRTGRSNLIGIVHFGADLEAARKSNHVLSRYVNLAGYDYLSVDMDWHEGSVERTLNELIQARVEGVLISHIQKVFNDRHIDVLARASIPVVSINGEERQNVPLICDDVEKAFYGITRHLIETGHRCLLHLTSSSSAVENGRQRAPSQRKLGFRRAVQECGEWRVIKEEDFFSSWPNHDVGGEKVCGISVMQDSNLYDSVDRPNYKFCRRLFATGILPDAIVCSNDMYAMEVIAAGLEQGIRVPENLAVTGYDNDRIGEYPAFALTTAEQDVEGICSAAVKILTERIKNPHSEVICRSYESKLILRASCGRNLARKKGREKVAARLEPAPVGAE